MAGDRRPPGRDDEGESNPGGQPRDQSTRRRESDTPQQNTERRGAPGPQGAGTRRREQSPREQRRAGNGAAVTRIERFRQVVVWPESVIIGVSTWLVGFLLTVIPLWWFDFGSDLNVSTVDLGVWVYVESVGGSVGIGGDADGEVLVATESAYTTLSSNAFGLGPAVHTLLPALVLVIAGYLLAGRHIKAGTTGRPLEVILAGGSLAVWFTLTLFVAAVVTSGDVFSVDLGETLVTTLLYTAVFASIGATVRSRTGLTSAWGLLAGIGAFAVGLVFWYLLEDPFGEFPGVDGFSDLDGVFGYTQFLLSFVREHGVEAGEIVPTWFVVVVPLVFGAVLAYVYERSDPVVGFGEGARLGAAYAALVFVVVVGQIGAQARELEQTFDAWPEAEVETVNLFVASAPREIFLGGIVYPVVFAAVGGAVGALVYGLQNADRSVRQSTQERPPAGEPRPHEPPAGGYQQPGQQPPDQQHQSNPQPGQQPPDQQYQSNPQPGQQPPDQQYQSNPQPGQQPPDQQHQSNPQPGQQPPDQQYQSDPQPGQQPPGQFDQQSPEPDGPTDPGPEGPDEDTNASGEELSPGDIVGDSVDGDDADEDGKS